MNSSRLLLKYIIIYSLIFIAIPVRASEGCHDVFSATSIGHYLVDKDKKIYHITRYHQSIPDGNTAVLRPSSFLSFSKNNNADYSLYQIVHPDHGKIKDLEVAGFNAVFHTIYSDSTKIIKQSTLDEKLKRFGYVNLETLVSESETIKDTARFFKCRLLIKAMTDYEIKKMEDPASSDNAYEFIYQFKPDKLPDNLQQNLILKFKEISKKIEDSYAHMEASIVWIKNAWKDHFKEKVTFYMLYQNQKRHIMYGYSTSLGDCKTTGNTTTKQYNQCLKLIKQSLIERSLNYDDNQAILESLALNAVSNVPKERLLAPLFNDQTGCIKLTNTDATSTLMTIIDENVYRSDLMTDLGNDAEQLTESLSNDMQAIVKTAFRNNYSEQNYDNCYYHLLRKTKPKASFIFLLSMVLFISVPLVLLLIYRKNREKSIDIM